MPVTFDDEFCYIEMLCFDLTSTDNRLCFFCSDGQKLTKKLPTNSLTKFFLVTAIVKLKKIS